MLYCLNTNVSERNKPVFDRNQIYHNPPIIYLSGRNIFRGILRFNSGFAGYNLISRDEAWRVNSRMYTKMKSMEVTNDAATLRSRKLTFDKFQSSIPK
jgi:hypothetical protein